MFGRRKQQEVDLTAEAYARWLRARQPQPLAWFLGLSRDQQETLADLGEAYTADVVAAIGYASNNLGSAATIGSLGDADGAQDEAMARSVAGQAVERILAQRASRASRSARTGPDLTRPSTMGGLKRRRVGAERARQAAKDTRRRFMGASPDGGGA